MSREKRFVIQVDPLEIEDDAIYDNKELRLYECQSDMMSDICSLLNKQDQRIAELEEQLKNAIVPKFKVGQEVWTEWKGDIVELKIKSLYWDCNQVIEYRLKGCMYLISRWKDELFATKEEALAKLEELGEKR